MSTECGFETLLTPGVMLCEEVIRPWFFSTAIHLYRMNDNEWNESLRLRVGQVVLTQADLAERVPLSSDLA